MSLSINRGVNSPKCLLLGSRGGDLGGVFCVCGYGVLALRAGEGVRVIRCQLDRGGVIRLAEAMCPYEAVRCVEGSKSALCVRLYFGFARPVDYV